MNWQNHGKPTVTYAKPPSTSGKPTTVCINLHELYNFYKHLLETTS